MSFRFPPPPHSSQEAARLRGCGGPQKQVSSVISFEVGYEITENVSQARKSEQKLQLAWTTQPVAQPMLHPLVY